MTKSAQIKFAREIDRVAMHAYDEALCKQAAARGVEITTPEDRQAMYKIASMLRNVKTRMSTAILHSAAEDLSRFEGAQ